MAREKSTKTSSKSKAPPLPQHGARARPTTEPGHAASAQSTTTSKTKKSFFGFLRSDKSKSKKITLTVVGHDDKDASTAPTSDATANNNVMTRSSSFSEPGSSSSSKQEQPTRKVKRHLSVSRSGKMKEIRKRTSLAELAQRFDNQAQTSDSNNVAQ